MFSQRLSHLFFKEALEGWCDCSHITDEETEALQRFSHLVKWELGFKPKLLPLGLVFV